MSNYLAQSLKLIQTCFVLSQATSGQEISWFCIEQVTNVMYFDQLSGAARTRNASWLTFLCCFQPFVDFRTFSVIFLKTTSWTRNQLILYGARLQMLCISTSFRVLHALESWLTFCLWPYSTIFVDFRSFSVILSQTTTGHKISCFCIEQGDKNNRWKANMILLKKQSWDKSTTHCDECWQHFWGLQKV